MADRNLRGQRPPVDSAYSEVVVKTQRAADIAVGSFIALFGIFVLLASTMISVRGVTAVNDP